MANSEGDNKILQVIGEYYIQWSTALKNKNETDPIKTIENRIIYKEYAAEGTKILEMLEEKMKNHKYYFSLSQGYFNQWKYEKALNLINKSIELSGNEQSYQEMYKNYRFRITQYFSKKR
jgi:hypothetical protein